MAAKGIQHKAGERFGILTIVKKVDNDSHREYKFLCKCDCGNFCESRGYALRNGNTVSCKCIRRQRSHSNGLKNIIDLTGKKFGKWTVLERSFIESGKIFSSVYWRCICDCSSIKSISASDLKRNDSKSCGCSKQEYRRESKLRLKRELKNV